MVDLFDDFGKTDDLQLLKKRGINVPKEWRKVLPSTRDKYNFSLIAYVFFYFNFKG